MNKKLEWRENQTPVSVEFEDIYFNTENGLEESRHVFLKANGLPDRWQGHAIHVIGELGFGTGLNFFATWDLWNKTKTVDSKLHFITCEKFPLSKQDIQKALEQFPELSPLLGQFIPKYPDDITQNKFTMDFGDVKLDAYIGDVFDTLSQFPDEVDTWFLDGFNPKKNPEMWDEAVLKQVATKSKLGSSLATFTAVSDVRRQLEALDFKIQKLPGWGKKREMIQGFYKF